MARKLVARALWAAGSAELVPRLKLQSSIPSLRSQSYVTDHCRRGRPCSKKNPKNSRTTRLSHGPRPLRGVLGQRKVSPGGFFAAGRRPMARRVRDLGLVKRSKLHSRHYEVSPALTFHLP